MKKREDRQIHSRNLPTPAQVLIAMCLFYNEYLFLIAVISYHQSCLIGGGWNKFSFKASAGYTDATNTESSDTTKIFKKYNGEVIMAKATCITNVISISEYVRPFFTKNFH